MNKQKVCPTITARSAGSIGFCNGKKKLRFLRRLPGLVVTAAGIVGLGWTGWLEAATLVVPNASFESPETEFAGPPIDSWQKSAKPVWWDEATFGPWDQLTGLFLNLPPGDARHIDNCDGDQAMFLFAVPQVAIFQDYDSISGTNTTPSHEFDAQYEVGKSYTLTVGVIGGLGDMQEGVTLQLSLYYRDAESNQVTVAATTITNLATTFSNANHLIDFQVTVPTVQPVDPWAGQHLGVQILSTVGFELQGGYWDLDHVRLTAASAPILRGITHSGEEFQFQVESEPGLEFEILASTDLTSPLAEWSSLGILTNTTGTATFTTPMTNSLGHYYRARQLP